MTLSKRFMMGTLGVALAFGFLLASCGGGDDNTPATVDKSALEAGIAKAENAKVGVLVGTQAGTAAGLTCVSQADMTTFENAISEAKAVRDNSSASQADVNTATQTLNTAVDTFNDAKAEGTKTSGFTAEELTDLIATAEAAKQGVEISTKNGTDKPASVYWVTPADMDAFAEAITAAEGSGDIDAKYLALVAAINTFNAAKQPGIPAETVTMSGTVRLLHMPTPQPQIAMQPYYIMGNGSFKILPEVTVTVNGNTGTWAMPRDNDFLTALDSGDRTVTFEVWVQFAQGENYVLFGSDLSTGISKTTDRTNINLGTINLAALTLSGTFNVTFNGQPLDFVRISSVGNGNSAFGFFEVSGSATPWTLRIPALAAPETLSLSVAGYSAVGPESLFFKYAVQSVSGPSGVNAIPNIVITYDHPFSPSSPTSLTLDTWIARNLPGNDTETWYQFTSDGSAYYVRWNDAFDGNGEKNGDIQVSAYTSAGIPLFAEDSGWTTPRAIPAGQSGTIYLKVERRRGYNSGAYAIKYYKSSAGN